MSIKVGIIGHFGGQENILDGQTIKTKILFEELEKSTNWEIKKVDTYYKSKNPIKLIWESLVCLCTVKNIIVLLSGNGMRFYFPILYFGAKFFQKKIYHDVIGGNLDLYVDRYPQFKKYLNSFTVNWVETDNLKKRLESRGVFNCRVMPNFKKLICVFPERVNMKIKKPYCFCTFSRVMKEKGIEEAIEVVQKINEKAGYKICSLDIYGMIDNNYKIRFHDIMNNATSAIRYCGEVEYDKSVEVIRKYYALLFPTHWIGEGFPGTIIDAFFSGVPTIATDWNANSEIIEHMNTGIIYPHDGIKCLYDAVYWAINNQEKIYEMKNNCLKESEKYRADKFIKSITEFIEKNGVEHFS